MREILSLLPEASKTLRRFRYDARTILMVILRAILRDRPMNWACREENWPTGQRPAKLPSPSTISRRWRQSRLHDWARQIHEQAVARVGFRSAYAVVDARPLPVGGGSKDPDARPGRAVGHLSKGHKLFAVVAAGGAIAQYEIGAMGDPN